MYSSLLNFTRHLPDSVERSRRASCSAGGTVRSSLRRDESPDCTEPPSDLDLAAFQRGRETANATPLLALYDRSSGRAVGLALRILGDVNRAEDVVEQDTLELWRSPLFDPRLFDSLDAWFLAHIHRAAIDVLRAQQDAGSPHDVSEEVKSSAVDPEHTTTSGDAPDERQALDLTYLAGLTYDVIAARCDTGFNSCHPRSTRTSPQGPRRRHAVTDSVGGNPLIDR